MVNNTYRKASKEQAKIVIEMEEPYPKNFVWWNEINQDELDEYKRVLNYAKNERIMQRFFEEHPNFLIQHLSGGHGRWCIPQKKLGCQYVPDFIIGSKDSMGYRWFGLELESPQATLFTSKGNPSVVLVHAMKQIVEWSSWLEDNIDYARRPIELNGLGLTDISGELKSYIIIGRRNQTGNDTSRWRRYMRNRLQIEIHTYDWLLEKAEIRLKSLKC